MIALKLLHFIYVLRNLAVNDGAFTRIPDGPYLEDFRSCSSAKATFHNINPIKFRKLMFGAQNKPAACENDLSP
jgi:hypothetical protein